MNSKELNRLIGESYACYLVGKITQHELIILISSVLKENNIPHKVMVGDVFLIRKDEPKESFYSKWIFLFKDDLIVDYCFSKVTGHQIKTATPFNIVSIADLQNCVVDGKKCRVKYIGTETPKESSKEAISYVKAKVESVYEKVEKAKEQSQ